MHPKPDHIIAGIGPIYTCMTLSQLPSIECAIKYEDMNASFNEIAVLDFVAVKPSGL